MNRTFGRTPAIGFTLPLMLLAGCVGMDTNPPAAIPTAGAPCQLVANCRPDIYFAPDPAHGGVERPTLFGRIYLFGPEVGNPMIGDGKLVVDLYEGAVPKGAKATPLEEWQFDPVTLKGLLKRDMLGWGYTVPLPWGTYRPDITFVQVNVRYEPAKGAPIYADGAPMAIKPADKDGGPVVTESSKMVTAARPASEPRP